MRNLYKIENLQDELYQLENKQTKSFLAMLQNFFKVLKDRICKIFENICAASTDDIN